MTYHTFGDARYSLKDLLEIPELQHPPLLNRQLDLKKNEVTTGYGIGSAFLGPNLWNNASQIVGQDNAEFSLQYMDLDEFLSENGIPSSELKKSDSQQALGSREAKQAVSPPENYIQLQTAPTSQALSPGLPPKGAVDPKPTPRQVYEDVHETSAPSSYYNSEGLRSPSSPYKSTENSSGPNISSQLSNDNCKDHPAQPGIADSRPGVRRGDINGACPNQHSPGQGSPVPSPSHPAHGQNSPPTEFDLNSTDLALASIPGQENFDPRKCKFSEEELKPQPIIRKSRKVFVPDACKDEKYWMRRSKNNIAAKRSREARRIKENQIALRAAFLEKENNTLKDEVKKIKEENVKLLRKLSQYEQVGK